MAKVKICGLTNDRDARLAIKYGAHFIGTVVFSRSERNVDIEDAKRILGTKTPFMSTVAVTNSKRLTDIEQIAYEISPDFIQLQDDIHPELIRRMEYKGKFIKAIPVSEEVDYGKYFKGYDDVVSAYLLDTQVEDQIGGTGTPHNWEISSKIVKASQKPVFLAGGLTPLNVMTAIRAVRPYAVDVSSGVEKSVGVKSEDKIKAFTENARD